MFPSAVNQNDQFSYHQHDHHDHDPEHHHHHQDPAHHDLSSDVSNLAIPGLETPDRSNASYANPNPSHAWNQLIAVNASCNHLPQATWGSDLELNAAVNSPRIPANSSSSSSSSSSSCFNDLLLRCQWRSCSSSFGGADHQQLDAAHHQQG
jgi:hypothetical protein